MKKKNFFPKFEKSSIFAKISKIHQMKKIQNIIIFKKNMKKSSFFVKIWKVINLCQNFKKSSIFVKNFKILSFFVKISKNHHFWPKFSSYIIFLSITLVSPVSRDLSHSLSISKVLRHFCDTGMSSDMIPRHIKIFYVFSHRK